MNRFAEHFARVFRTSSESVDHGAVPASFVAPMWGIFFCDCGESEACCGESVDARKSDNLYDGSYSPVVVAVAPAGVCF